MGRPTKYGVALSEDERQQLGGLVRRGKTAARQVTRARILLLADAKEPQKTIMAALGVCRKTVQEICKRYCEEGLEAALGEKPRPGGKPRLDGKQEAFLIALTCTDAPEGRACWSMQLLADRLVELGVVEEISGETVRRVLKKGGSIRGGTSSGASRR